MNQGAALPTEGTFVIRSGDWSTGDRPGESVRMLVNDPAGYQTMVMKLAAGPLGVLHDHDMIEQIYVIDGDFFDDESRYQAGDLVVRMPGTMHRAGSDNGCTLLITYTPCVRASA